ncbi:MAG TPA: DUF4105 domain-containing protein [Pirellulaceae bacterium]|jgi:hypothetical protein
MERALSRTVVIAITAAVAGLAGCASVQPKTAGTTGQSRAVELISHLTDVAPPKLEFPEWQAPQLDLSFLNADNRKPSNDRDWIDEQKVLASAEIDGDKARIRNVRNAEYYTYRDCVVDYYDKTYDLAKIKSVDFVVIPFAENKAIAHTMLSFGFEGDEYVGVSVEVRLEKGESYSTAAGFLGQFELMYVVADEHDLLPVRPEFRHVDVLLYRSTATPAQAKALFLDVMKRVNQLHDHPEFYDTLRNNCTTNIVRHINAIVPGEVPYDYRVLLPGYSDEYAYDLKLIDTSLPFVEVRRRARVSDRILQYKDDARFSERIRETVVR